MKRLLYILAAVALVAVAGIVAIPFALSPAFVAGKLSAAVEAATGRSLVMGSAPRLTLWPELAVEIDNVVLSNPPGMFAGRFASIDKLRLRIGIEPLLQRRLDIRELTLVRPRIGFIVDGEGHSNWSFEKVARPSPGAKSDKAAADALSLAPVVIEDGDFRYLDERSGTALAVEHVDVSLDANQLDGPVSFKGNVTWKNERLRLDVYAKAPQRLVGEGSPIDLTVGGALINLNYDGLARLDGGLGLAGRVDMSTPSLRDLARWAGKPLAPGGGLKAFSLQGALDLTSSVVTIKDATVALDGMNGKGNLSIDTRSERPAVTASLGIDRLNVDAYLGAPQPPVPAGTPGVDQWSAAPIDLSGLASLDARLVLTADALAYRDVAIGRSRIDATLRDGRLIARLDDMAFYGGKASGEIVLSSGKGDAIIQGRLAADGIDGGRLLKDFAGIGRLTGKARLSVALAARGKSQRALVSTLNGAANLRFIDGAIRGIDIASMIRNVASGTLSGWDESASKDTGFALLEASYKIADGVATGDDLKFSGPLIRVTGKGSADLLRRRLDYKLEPKLVVTPQDQGGKETLTGLPVPVVVSGSWTAPKIYPDIKGVLQDPKAAYDALRKMAATAKALDLNSEAAKMGDKAGQAPDSMKPAADAAQKQSTQ